MLFPALAAGVPPVTKMIPAAEFKAAVRKMLDTLGDGPVDAEAIRATG